MGLSRHSFVDADRVMGDHLAISLGQHSTSGPKPENQDFHGALVPTGEELTTKGAAFALADGISTSRLGAEAAETAVKSFLNDYFSTSAAWLVRTSGERVIAATNGWMYSRNRRDMRISEETRESGLVCTLSALVLKSRSAHVFHIGDCQVARISGDDLEVLTEAHRISIGSNQSYLARAMGVGRQVDIDYRKVPVQVGDVFVMTSDGVHEVLDAGTIVRVIRGATSLDKAASALCEAALERGADDNLTAQVIRIDALPAGEVGDLVGEQTALPPAPLLEAGQSFEGYRILRVLYSGARSRVYLARDEEKGERVTIKTPTTETATDKRQVAALMLEEWAIRRTAHQNLVSAPSGSGRTRGHVYAVSRYVEGQSLDEWLADNPEPELSVVRDIVRQIASGLLALHRKEMVHRDLRPHNVMIDTDGTVKIIDFGSVAVAGLEETAPGTAGEAAYAGTVQFAAPEVYRGEEASAQSDIYSLGAIAYHLLTGELPYGPRIANATTWAEQKKLRYRPIAEITERVPRWMDAAIAKACAIDPANRYSELSEFTYDLSHPNSALVTDMRPLIERGTTRHWRIAAILLAVALAISILTRPDIGLF
ncbi:bifunctional protein-serine/threonine kinase/phosphatase [Croceicoccus gelatinilyticus]|uniref:bifunctional protein-serine/threonine kinase/phosphatase n=1 Tax=Croceicoccus gelatinilyticus TaxID=2835536 RepID=UPI001BD0A3CF|nr:bifunctional protein-serine/threonine kinase/phosphatase [Croceicoccus gelatinilyticus]MBS7668685.1 bifunctional protein-serine/threonine kinase/phosphatase [Croceicoccus gelatinilyticus]